MSVSNAVFDSSDPFPLLSMNDHTYREAQIHAAEVDLWLGLRTFETEALIQACETESVHKFWIGLPIQALLTPYIEFRQMLDLLKPSPGETVIDFGAGYGRMGFVICQHYRGVNFIGFEVIRERADEGARCLKRHGCSRAQMICADVDSQAFQVPEAEFYFIYDFSDRGSIDRLLRRLQTIALNRKITIVARGRSSRDAIDHEHPWLSQVVKPQHFQNFSIYRSRMN